MASFIKSTFVPVFLTLLTGCGTGPAEPESVQQSDSALFFNGGRWPLTHDTAGLGSGIGADVRTCYDFPMLVNPANNPGDICCKVRFPDVDSTLHRQHVVTNSGHQYY